MSKSLQNKLSRFEATPPFGLWDKIEEALDAQEGYTKRLYDYEEQPRTNLWKNIEACLDEPEKKVVPLVTKYKTPLRYIAAASIIAVSLVATTLLRKKVSADTIPVQTASVLPLSKKTNPVADSNVNYPPTPEREPSATSTNSSSAPIVSRQTYGVKKQLTAVNEGSQNKRTISKAIPRNSLFGYAPSDAIHYSSNSGDALKSSKKISSVNCADGDEACKERIRLLRQKLSSATTTADFAGLLDMIRQLQ